MGDEVECAGSISCGGYARGMCMSIFTLNLTPRPTGAIAYRELFPTAA